MLITSLSQLDLSKQYTYADYLTWQLSERIELLKGYIRQMAAPNPFHQEVSGELFNVLKNYLKAHRKTYKVFHAPFDVRLVRNPLGTTDKEIYTVVEPDLCVICDRSKIDKRGCIGAPDLIIEILSPNNSKTDLQDKFQLYEENGVAEYWIVFPLEKIVEKFILHQEKYKLENVYNEQDQAIPNLFPDLLIDLTEVFEEI
jgi:Uma2 family endonuclease